MPSPLGRDDDAVGEGECDWKPWCPTNLGVVGRDKSLSARALSLATARQIVIAIILDAYVKDPDFTLMHKTKGPKVEVSACTACVLEIVNGSFGGVGESKQSRN